MSSISSSEFVMILFSHPAQISSFPSFAFSCLSIVPLLLVNSILSFTLGFLPCFSPLSPPFLPLCPLHQPTHCLFPAHSSVFAGCRGSCFLMVMSRVNLRVREQLFSSLLRQDLGFFQDTKTGEAWSACLGSAPFPNLPCPVISFRAHPVSPVPWHQGLNHLSLLSTG